MIRLSAEQRAIVHEGDAIKRAARQEAKRSRPAKVRPTAPGQRQPRLRDNGHLQFIRRLPCVVSVYRGLAQTTPTQAAHVRHRYPEPGWRHVGGAEKPDDWRTLPLSAENHAAQHARGDEEAYWREVGLYPPAMIAVFLAAREAGRDGMQVVLDALAAGRCSPDNLGLRRTEHTQHEGCTSLSPSAPDASEAG